MQNKLQKFIYTNEPISCYSIISLIVSVYLTTSDWFEDPNKASVTSNGLNRIICLYVYVVDYVLDDIMPTDPPDI